MIISALKKLPFWRRYTTNQFKNWWKNRDIDWEKEYKETWNHPHRKIITDVLKQFAWSSLYEIGCGAGANLINISRNIPNRYLGGVDINPKAIEVANKTFKGGFFTVGSADDIMLSGKATDVVLSDMCLIYVGPTKINKYIQEIKRISRGYVILLEMHSNSWIKRLWLRLFSGHNSYNYDKLLRKNGFYDIIMYKLNGNIWGDDNQFRHLIIAKTPKR